MKVDAIADELYGLPPKEFTSTRNDWAQAARVAGDRALAEQIRGLRKPTAVAYLANQMVRHHADLIESLLKLGKELRAAMAAGSGQDLRGLNARQRELVQSLQQRAGELADSAGLPATDAVLRGLADTFRAALADPEAAETLAAGRLAEALTPAVFAGLPPALSTPSPRTAEPNQGKRDELGAVRRKRAELALVEAQDLAEAARHALKQAKASQERATRRSHRAAERVKFLRAELADATAEHDSAQQAAEGAARAQTEAELAAHEAEQRLGAARDALAGAK